MPRFSVGIYNKAVRDAVNRGERHRDLSDGWADIHYVDVDAANREEARIKILRRYAPSQGYVVTDVILEP